MKMFSVFFYQVVEKSLEPDFTVIFTVPRDLFMGDQTSCCLSVAVIPFMWSCPLNRRLVLCRSSHGDAVHRASLRPGGGESHLHLPGHGQPSHHGLQVRPCHPPPPTLTHVIWRVGAVAVSAVKRCEAVVVSWGLRLQLRVPVWEPCQALRH